jgi:light-regulated signal transduction histidine kinase (bacteriophytochrome)/CheY-like chemotaxis protein
VGGNPNKTYQTGPLGDRLTPRKSFAIWKETVQRQSQPWTVSDREIAEAARTALLEVIMRQTELLATERRKAEVRQKILNEELNHRVKNILALIKSVVSQPVGTRTIEEYVGALRGRIMALAVAHDQVVRDDGGGSLRGLLEAELTPYSGGAAQIALDGPNIGVDARAYSVMALVFHELSTNAAKYGALSARGGKLSVGWSMTADGACEIWWRESGGPSVSAPGRKGFGTVLVDRSVPFDLGGESELRFEPSGVDARFVIPARFVTTLAPSSILVKGREDGEITQDTEPLSGLDVLVVEDQLVIAMDLENVLSDHGARAIYTAASAAEALRIIAAKNVDVAVLDVNLGVGTSMEVADELVRRSVPFIFATGYGDTAMIPGALRSIPVVRKPHEAQSLVAAVARVLSLP